MPGTIEKMLVEDYVGDTLNIKLSIDDVIVITSTTRKGKASTIQMFRNYFLTF